MADIFQRSLTDPIDIKDPEKELLAIMDSKDIMIRQIYFGSG
jgi:hypothetical protein